MGFPVEPPNGGRQDWGTPDELFSFLDGIYGFDVDAAANDSNHKCSTWFGPGAAGDIFPIDALDPNLDWAFFGKTFFLNWPYGRKDNPVWAEMAYRMAMKHNVTIVGLCFARFETEWWEDWVDGKAREVLLLRPRVKFVGAKHTAQVPSAAIVWGPHSPAHTQYVTMRWKMRKSDPVRRWEAGIIDEKEALRLLEAF